MKIAIINGPNLNLLGKRQPEIYGSTSFEEYLKGLRQLYPKTQLIYEQSNHEGAIIDLIQMWGYEADGLILNAGAFTHTSLAIADAIAAIPKPVVEVHISNVHRREAVRHHSYISPNAAGVIVGFGLAGYELALRYLAEHYHV
jgi:3-dehydroquinate dehydratase-2